MILLKVMPSRGEYFYRAVASEAEAEELYTQYHAVGWDLKVVGIGLDIAAQISVRVGTCCNGWEEP